MAEPPPPYHPPVESVGTSMDHGNDTGIQRWATLPLRIAIMAMILGFGVLLVPIPTGGPDAHAFLLAATCIEALVAMVAAAILFVRIKQKQAGMEPAVLVTVGLLAACLVVPLTARGFVKIRAHVQRSINYGPELEKLAEFYDALNRFAQDNGGRFPTHVSQLTDRGLPATLFWSSWRRLDQSLPAASSKPQPVYRFGDFVFCHAGLDPNHLPADSILAFTAKLAPTERDLSLQGTRRYEPNVRAVLFGDGRTLRVPDHQFDKLLENENLRRTQQFGLPAIETRQFDPEPGHELMVHAAHLVYS